MSKKLYLIMVVVGVLLGFIYFRYGTNYTPPGQPPLLALERTDYTKLIDSFNAAADSTRVLLLLSPT